MVPQIRLVLFLIMETKMMNQRVCVACLESRKFQTKSLKILVGCNSGWMVVNGTLTLI